MKLGGSVSELEKHSAKIEEAFAKNPPKTRSEAAEQIKRMTGVERSVWSVSRFLKKRDKEPSSRIYAWESKPRRANQFFV